MSGRIYLEGGGDSKELRTRCREGFRKLLDKCGLPNHFQLVACGPRNEAYNHFCTAWNNRKSQEYLALLVDSEDPVEHGELTWQHLNQRDGWSRPKGARDEAVLLMTTCMETWIVTDQQSLKAHYGSKLNLKKLPPLTDLERRNRHQIQDALEEATKECSNAYLKNKRSFKVLALLDPQQLGSHLPAFTRMLRILRNASG